MSIIDLLKKPIAYQPAYVPFAGVQGAVFLSQAAYWRERTKDPDGWFYKTQEEWESETGLTRSQQESIRKNLGKLGVIQEKKQGIPCRIFYRINVVVLERILLEQISPPKIENKEAANEDSPQEELPSETPANLSAENLQTSMQEPCKQASGKPASSAAENLQAITENTQRLPENTNKRSRAGDSKVLDKSKIPKSLDWDLWLEWLAYRKSIKKPYKTEAGELSKMNQLIKLAGDDRMQQAKIVSQSILNEWVDLYPIKQPFGTPQNRVNPSKPPQERDFSAPKGWNK